VKAARFPATTTWKISTSHLILRSLRKQSWCLCQQHSLPNSKIFYWLVRRVGKTHISLAIGYAAVCNGYSVFYRSSFDLVADMAEAHRNSAVKNWYQNLSDIICLSSMNLDEKHAAKCSGRSAWNRSSKVSNSINNYCYQSSVADWGPFWWCSGNFGNPWSVPRQCRDDPDKRKSFRLSKNKSNME